MEFLFLIATIGLILGLKFMGDPAKAVLGNAVAAISVVIALIGVTVKSYEPAAGAGIPNIVLVTCLLAAAAWMSLFAYIFMAANAFIAVVWRIKISEILAMTSAPVGAMFTAVTLLTGAIWGKPMWGTWWTWDARLTSELVLLFLYLGVIGLYSAIEDRRQAARAASFLGLIGIVNVPIVHFSVNWWNTLHQGSTVRLLGPSRIDASMLWPLLLMALATHIWFFASVLARSRTSVLEQESGKEWVREIVQAQGVRHG
ncbi:MAG TPA: heme ABC transporter permease CcmC [Dokdonella sp.]|nr:heme ABC transporter permease CcmC [Dokdonella sp.]